ncbi:nascent polypeptide-associated complex subunit alpha, muscle-specific form-like [Gallus gallus]|uniref:nascent polypeptide-associated complex subunit alpha, muscle-specific form-like n=1 Tax=Gallus gallus TaxID=9031 RepID=UPI001AE70542|nr:nascent polypeptide-associated complex subunit alpha, muscle-specific form-like [Gallus gallus]XP_046783072.1 nascent polypeptide-associated complex subunit alpha, muscle-specific form-like [Gallus gallus]
MGLVISGPEIRVCRAPPEGGDTKLTGGAPSADQTPPRAAPSGPLRATTAVGPARPDPGRTEAPSPRPLSAGARGGQAAGTRAGRGVSTARSAPRSSPGGRSRHRDLTPSAPRPPAHHRRRRASAPGAPPAPTPIRPRGRSPLRPRAAPSGPGPAVWHNAQRGAPPGASPRCHRPSVTVTAAGPSRVPTFPSRRLGGGGLSSRFAPFLRSCRVGRGRNAAVNGRARRAVSPAQRPNVPAGASRTARSLPYPDRVGSSSAVSPHPAPARGQPPAPRIPPGGDSGLPPRGAAQRLPALTEHRVLKCRPTNSGLAVGTRGTRGCLCNFSHTAAPMTLYFTRGLPALTGDRLSGHVARPVGEGRSRTAAPPGRTPPTARPVPPLPCPFKTRRPAHLPQRCRFRKCHVYVVRMRAAR